MILPGKVHGELIKLYYQNGMNNAKALRVYRRSHSQRRGPYTLLGLRNLIKKIRKYGRTCDKPQ